MLLNICEYLLGRIFWPTALMYILDTRANSLILITALRFGLIRLSIYWLPNVTITEGSRVGQTECGH
jgi:hypothetical protein